MLGRASFFITLLKEERLPKGLIPVPIAAKMEPAAVCPVAAIGYPGDRGQTVSHGTLIHEPDRTQFHPIPLDLNVQPGFSGGVLINPAGDAIGVMVGRLSDELAFAADLTNLLPFPERGSPVLSLAESKLCYEGSPAELNSQGLGVLHFWAQRGREFPTPPAAIEWARARFLSAASKRPAFVEALVNAGICSARLKQFQDAISCFRRACRAAPGSLLPRLLLSQAYGSSGDLRRAKMEARAVVSASPSFIPARRALAAYHSTSKEFTAAIAHLKTVLRLRPNDRPALMALGNALEVTRQHGDAAAHYVKLLELDPPNAPAHRALGRCYALAGRYREAALAWKSAVRLVPGDTEAQYGLAIACLHAGDREQALRVHRNLQRLDNARWRRLGTLIRMQLRARPHRRAPAPLSKEQTP